MAAEKSRILVVGGTGCLGRHVVAASARLGHPIHPRARQGHGAVRPGQGGTAQELPGRRRHAPQGRPGRPRQPGERGQARRRGHLHRRGAADPRPDQARRRHRGGRQRQEVPPVGVRPGRRPLGGRGPTRSMLTATKAAIRRAVEAAGVPYTYVLAGYFFCYGLPGVGQVLAQAPPVDKAVVLGDGDARVVFVDEADIAAYTVLAAGDPRAENKTLHIRPPANTLSHNELLALWEGKTGRTLERVHVPEDAVLKQIQEASIPMNLMLSIGHATHIKGEQSKLGVDPASGVDAGELFPDVKYTTVDDYLDRLL
ncbi:hypothetical protein GQ55_5G446000 [Panicum hallii var. hallii]|uniref:NmrA-like domain-containing protein n=1 Tax=Panicum hallii var. hallii TaxID=1504633 RepID=A0A2T7DPV6_9POAL|nr:hypothetical protein GQ55_5G446000 [Panicum hallii var. hallii]